MRTFHFHRKGFFLQNGHILGWKTSFKYKQAVTVPARALPHCRTARTATLLSLQSNFAHNCIHEDFTRTNLIGWRVIIWPAGIRTQLFALNEKSTLTARPPGQTATALQELAEVLQLQRHPIDVRARLRNPEADLGPIPNLSGLFSVT